jgi:TetR/AcrR family transcriptional regulator, regulator of mycofactocin system
LTATVETQRHSAFAERIEDQMPLRKQKMARTRQALVEAAMDLFDQNGFEATTVDDIAAAADVSRRTFFRYFPAKDLVLFPHQDLYLDQFSALLADRKPNEEPFDALRRALLEMGQYYMESREEHLRQQRIIRASPTLIAKGNKFDEDWEDAIAELLIADLPQDETTVRRVQYLAGAVIGTVRVILREWYGSECTKDLVALGDEGISIVVHGAARLFDEG